VNRGGSWNNNATNTRVANRNNNSPTNTNNNLGFRITARRNVEIPGVQGLRVGDETVQAAILRVKDTKKRKALPGSVGLPKARGDCSSIRGSAPHKYC